MTAPVTVTVADAVSAELVDAFARLVPQLSTSSAPPGKEELTEMIGQPGTFVLVARDGDTILGTLTLVTFRIPTGMRAWIEDVVVDEAARGRGVGEALAMKAVDIAAGVGAKTVDLTSRPSREAANRLYQRLGFTLRETNIYRRDLRR